MSGIREEIDLDVTAALRKVAELEAAVGKATKSNLKIDTAGVGGIVSAEKELTTYESVLGRAGVSGTKLLKVNQGLASSFSGEVKAGAKEAEKGVSGLGAVVEDARGRFGKLAGEAAGTLSPALGQVKGIVGEVSGAFTGAETAALGVAAGGAAVAVAFGLMAIKGVESFVHLADEVRNVQRVMGGTAEDASKLVAISTVLGVSTDGVAGAMFRLSNNIAKHGEKLRADGVEVAKNSKGQDDLVGTLENVATAYQHAEGPVAKNTILMDAFGRSGRTLIPILTTNREELEKFVKAAEQHHEILTQQDLDKARAYQIATRELGESFSGLERSIGIGIVPALTGLARLLTGGVEGVEKLGRVLTETDHKAKDSNFSRYNKDLNDVTKSAFGLAKSLVLGDLITDLTHHTDKAAEASKAHAEALVKEASTLKEVAPSTRLAADAAADYAPRVKELARAMGIDLVNATDKQKKALYEQVQKLYEAVTPTERLATVTGVLRDQYATAKESVDAMSTALDALIDVHINASEATINVRRAVDDLHQSMQPVKDDQRTLQQRTDDTTVKTFGLIKAVEGEVTALVKSGDVSTSAAAQKQALISRLVALANQFDGPVRQALIDYAYRAGALPTPKLDVDTTSAYTKLEKLNTETNTTWDKTVNTSRDKGKETGESFGVGIGLGVDNKTKAVEGAGERAGQALVRGAKSATKSSSPSRVGIEIGGYFVQGIALGIEQSQTLAYDAAYAQAHGLTDVYKKAAAITADEAKTIFAALDEVRDAQTRLNYIEHDRYATSEQLVRARLDVASAEQKVNDATFAALDSTQALTDATARQAAAARQAADAYGSMLGAYNATLGMRSAQRSLADANQALTDAQARQAQLPGEIANAEQDLATRRAAATAVTASEALTIVRARQAITDAEARLKTTQDSGTASADDLQAATLEVQVAQEALTKATADATSPTQDVTEAERTLADLRTEQVGIARKVRDATEAVTDAQLGLVGAEKNLVDSGTALMGTQDQFESFFRALGTAAGLTKDQIDGLISSIEKATAIAHNVAPVASGGQPGTTPGTQLVTVPGGGQVTQDFAAWFAQQPKSVQDSLVALGPGFAQSQPPPTSSTVSVPNLPPGVNPSTGQYGQGVSATPGTDPNLVASIVAGIGRQFGGSSPMIGTLEVHKDVDADIVIKKLAFAASGGGFGG